MRMGERYSQAERAIRGLASSGRIQIAGGLEHNLFVEIELVGADAGTGLVDGGGVVVPFKASIGFVPIDGPKYDEWES